MNLYLMFNFRDHLTDEVPGMDFPAPLSAGVRWRRGRRRTDGLRLRRLSRAERPGRAGDEAMGRNLQVLMALVPQTLRMMEHYL